MQLAERGQDVSFVHDEYKVSTPKVTNISGISDMTCSGRVFTPLELRAELKDKRKSKENVIQIEKMGFVVNDKIHRKKSLK